MFRVSKTITTLADYYVTHFYRFYFIGSCVFMMILCVCGQMIMSSKKMKRKYTPPLYVLIFLASHEISNVDVSNLNENTFLSLFAFLKIQSSIQLILYHKVQI